MYNHLRVIKFFLGQLWLTLPCALTIIITTLSQTRPINHDMSTVPVSAKTNNYTNRMPDG